MGLSDSQIFGLLRRMVDEALMFYAKSHGKIRWIDKTPNYAHIIQFIDAIFEEKVSYIVVVRHPFDCMLSLRKPSAVRRLYIMIPKFDSLWNTMGRHW